MMRQTGMESLRIKVIILNKLLCALSDDYETEK